MPSFPGAAVAVAGVPVAAVGAPFCTPHYTLVTPLLEAMKNWIMGSFQFCSCNSEQKQDRIFSRVLRCRQPCRHHRAPSIPFVMARTGKGKFLKSPLVQQWHDPANYVAAFSLPCPLKGQGQCFPGWCIVTHQFGSMQIFIIHSR